MLELVNIKKSYDGVTILKDMNLSIEKGEIVSILGPSGCGKTTLLNMILGITDPDSGKLLFNGEDITKVPMEKRGFNIVFQDYALFPNLNVYSNITYGPVSYTHLDVYKRQGYDCVRPVQRHWNYFPDTGCCGKGSHWCGNRGRGCSGSRRKCKAQWH